MAHHGQLRESQVEVAISAAAVREVIFDPPITGDRKLKFQTPRKLNSS